MASLIFSPLPSTIHLKSQNLSSSSSTFTPISISFSKSHSQFNSRGGAFYVSSAVVGFPPAIETSNSNGTLPKSTGLEITKLGISDEIVSALARRGITELFPIQRAVLDPAMEGRDLIGRAITGSGKTLAFGIPILDKIIRTKGARSQRQVPSALVLAPTRELARQVQKEFKESAPRLSSVCLYGGVPIMSQVRALGYGVDIAVGTPGRIIDLVERGALNLSEVRFVVLDEADQMLAVGFQEDVECILGYLPAKRQSMLFSATMPSWVNQLSKKFLKTPLVVDLVGDSDQKLAEGISLYSVVSSGSGKENMLPTLISTYGKGGKSIIFTRTKRDAEDLSRSMGSTLSSRALHGNMQQMARDRTLAAFRDGRFNVLVATDVAARGLDIPNVDLVIHYELPNTSEIFVHRSGRTGRAGKKGTAVLMYTRAQRRAVTTIERDIGCKFEEIPGSVANYGGAEERSYGGADYGRSSSPRESRYSDSFSEPQYGYGGSRGGSRGNSGYSDRSPSSEGSRGYGSTRKSNYSGSGNSHFGNPRRTQGSSYGDRPQRSNYGDRSQGSSYGGRSQGSGYGDRSQGNGYGDRSQGNGYGDRSQGNGYGDRSQGNGYGDRSQGNGYGDRSQGNSYSDFESDYKSEKSSVDKKHDGFKSIIDMLREQS